MTHTVRAKFFLNTVSYGQGSSQEKDEEGKPTGKYISVPIATVKLGAVGKGNGGDAEDALFGDATPFGNIEMTIYNPAAIEQLHAGLAKKWYVDFTQAPD